MGGSNQSTVQPQASSKQKTPIRVHENNGEIHFHDDASGKKVAVPVAQYFLKWDELKEGKSDTVQMRDMQRKTKVTLSMVEKGNDIDIDMVVEDFNPNFGPGYQALDKLTQ